MSGRYLFGSESEIIRYSLPIMEPTREVPTYEILVIQFIILVEILLESLLPFRIVRGFLTLECSREEVLTTPLSFGYRFLPLLLPFRVIIGIHLQVSGCGHVINGHATYVKVRVFTIRGLVFSGWVPIVPILLYAINN